MPLEPTHSTSAGTPARSFSALPGSGSRPPAHPTAPQCLQAPRADAIDLERIFFRSPRRTTTAQKQAAADLARSGVKLYRALTGAFRLPCTEVPDLSGYGADEAAAQLRLDWGLGCGALPDMMHLLESHGVRVLSLPAHADAVGSFSFWEDQQAFIFLATDTAAGTQRFELAHELGHLLLHSTLGTDPHSLALAEREADEFAARLLLPALSLQVRVGDALQLSQLLSLAEHFGVPAQVILSHSHRCGLLSDAPYQWLMQELAMEPAPAPARAVSRVFTMAFPSLRLENRTGTAQIAAELGLSGQQLHELTFGQAFVVLPGGNQCDGGQRAHLRAL